MQYNAFTSVVFIALSLFVVESVDYRDYVLDYYTKPADNNATLEKHRLHLDIDDNLLLPPALKIESRPTFFYIHGYFSLPSVQQKEAEIYFQNKKDAESCCHFFILDWSEGSCWTEYHIAMQRTRTVAETGYKMIKQLIAAGVIRLDQLTIVGHSLGAHVSGIVATLFWLDYQAMVATDTATTWETVHTETTEPMFDSTTDEVERSTEEPPGISFANHTEIDAATSLVAVVIALDPAGVEYGDVEDDVGLIKLRNGRALYTLVIHTNSIYGLTARLGDADFYPNGGRFQWNCIRRSKPNIFQRFGRCSHRIASILYWKTLGVQQYLSLRCDDHRPLLDQNHRKCVQQNVDSRHYIMAGDVLMISNFDRPRGIFYLETGGVKDDIHPMAVQNFTFGRREHEEEQMQKIRFPKWREILTSASRDIQTIH